MRLSATIRIAIFVLLIKFKYIKCSHHLDPNYETEAFEEYLREHVAKGPNPEKNYPLKDPARTANSEKQSEYSYHNIQPDSNSFVSDLKKIAHNNLNEAEKVEKVPTQDTSSAESGIQGVPANSDGSHKDPDKHHVVEEIIYIRRSDDEVNDPIPKVMEELIHNMKPPSEPKATPSDTTVLSNEPSASQDAQPTDKCSMHNSYSKVEQTCQSSAEYKIKFHNKYEGNLKSDMDSILPANNSKDSKCDYSKRTGPVEDRALCPFKWTVSDYNPARIPPYLFTAEQLCTKSRPILSNRNEWDSFPCVPIKRAIPVLWEVDCQDGQKKYKTGWEEIIVAYVPLEVKYSEDTASDSIAPIV